MVIEKYKHDILMVFLSLCAFFFSIKVYKHFHPYAFPGIEERTLFVLIPLAIITAIFYLPAKKVDRKTVISYLFLLSLILLTIDQFVTIPTIEDLRTYLFVTTIVLGVFAFWLNRETITEIEDEAKKEQFEEEIRIKEFSREYPRTNRIPAIRNILKWMYKEGWWCSGLIISISLLGFGLRFYGMGNHDFRTDEFQVISSAYGYYKTGMFYKWDWLNQNLSNNYYPRAWPHTWMVAQSFRLFGYSEWSARFPSLIFGTLLIPLAYFIGNAITRSKLIGSLLAIAVTLNPMMISLSRYTRMYVVWISLFFFGSYLLYLGLVKRSPWKFKNIPLINAVVKYFDFDYRYLLSAVIVLYMCYLVHINTLLIGIGIYIFVLVLAVCTKEKRYLYLFNVMTVGLLCLLLLYYMDIDLFHSNFITIRENPNWIYYTYLFSFPFTGIIASAILLSIIVSILKSKIILYYFILTLSTLIFFIFFANRYASRLYISNFMIISWLLLFYSSIFIMNLIFKKRKMRGKVLLSLLIITAIVYPLLIGWGGIYGNENCYGDFREAYKVINNNYQEGDLLMGQYLRTPYVHIQKNIAFERLLNHQRYPYEKFIKKIDKYDRIWVTWETRKSYHLDPKIIKYVDEHFEKLHGKGVDSTKVEVYFLEKGN